MRSAAEGAVDAAADAGAGGGGAGRRALRERGRGRHGGEGVGRARDERGAGVARAPWTRAPAAASVRARAHWHSCTSGHPSRLGAERVHDPARVEHRKVAERLLRHRVGLEHHRPDGLAVRRLEARHDDGGAVRRSCTSTPK